MYSLSTCWNSHRHTDGRAMLREIAELGFEYAELSHGIRVSLLPGIFEAVDGGEIKISTLHNFCPLPLGVNHAAPNIYKFTALESREREHALKHSLKTLETAARLKAKLVVLHMGAVEMKDYTDTLIDMVGERQRDGAGQGQQRGAPPPEKKGFFASLASKLSGGEEGAQRKYDKLCHEVMEQREARKEKHIFYAYNILRTLADKASELGLKLGIENREAVEEIPFEDDFRGLFKQFPPPTVGYWHDTGHGQIKENIGFINHAKHLAAMADRLHGFHIHDVQFPGRDHVPPGMGMIDFVALKPFVRPDHIKVFEMSPRVPTPDVKYGVNHIFKLWGKE